MNATQATPVSAESTAVERRLDIEFLFIDLDTCTRCIGTDATLLEALDLLRPALAAAHFEVEVTKRLIENEEQARRHRFVSSPTIRINGQDIAGEMIESACDSCSEACACGGTIDCRVWRYRGNDYTEAPTGLIVEAILRHTLAGAPVPEVADPVIVPENLRQFFQAKAGQTTVPISLATDSAAACCAPATLATCCEPDAKEVCCGSVAAGAPAGQCGCH